MLERWFDAQASPTQPWANNDLAASSADDDDDDDNDKELEEVVEADDLGGSALEQLASAPLKRTRVESKGN